MNPTEDLAVAETGKAITKYSAADAHEVGLPSPAALNFMFSVANMLYSSALVTKDMGLSKDQISRLQQFGIQGADLEERDRKAVVSNAMGKMLVGRELGIEPMAALQDIDIVKAKIFVRYPQLHRLIEEKGWDIEELERSHTRAEIRLTHPSKRPREFEFTIEDAKMAGLTKRGGYNGDSPSQYELRPRVMLWSRLISEAYRATGGKGSVYSLEEKREVLQEEVREAIAAPEPEHDPYAVQMPAAQAPAASSDVRAGKNGASSTDPASPRSSNSAAPIVESAANEAARLPGKDAVGDREVAVTDAPEAVVTASNPVSEPAPPVEMPKAKSNGGPSLADIEKMLPAKTRKKTIDEFLRGWFRKADMKAILADPGFLDALHSLESNAASAERKAKLEADPHGMGRKCADAWEKMRAAADAPEPAAETEEQGSLLPEDV